MTFAKWSGSSEVFAYQAHSGHYTVIVRSADDVFKSYHEKDLGGLKERLKLLRESGVLVEKAAIDLVTRVEREGTHETWDYGIRRSTERDGGRDRRSR